MNNIINRRIAIQHLLTVAGAALLIPACYEPSKKASIQLINLNISGDLETLLATLVENILPTKNLPKAKSFNLHLFVLKMVDDCHNEQDQHDFMEGIRSFEKQARQHLGKSFAKGSADEQAAFVQEVNAGNMKADKLEEFYKMVKSHTIQGFLYSEYVMKDLKKYELVPGRYNGYAPVAS
ncbi:gluconate 2-dehydrogenase subunit 3 family protein [Olivibacter sitiensis]|uniref:gluconate 2-dehydrogenase subunit 3 family protein n=1 Tax=Olivibacter sitiensis TaxID=376470 RepID=UPI0006840165|nr:gluconate 2-dehydrogenase subunit 3 family protein [Olivibacter sitiensis]